MGSEGTLGVITSVWLRLTPAPEAAWPVVAFFDGIRSGCAAIERIVGSGLPVAAIEYLDGQTMQYAGAGFPTEIPAGSFCVLTEADGSNDEAARVRAEVLELLGEDAAALYAPEVAAEIAALWRWRESVTLRVAAQRGGKVSEDIAVPLDRLAEAIETSLEIGRPGATRATGTSTPRIWCPRTTGASSNVPLTRRMTSSTSRSASAGRSPASTAWGC